jgi:hypothetical protein
MVVRPTPGSNGPEDCSRARYYVPRRRSRPLMFILFSRMSSSLSRADLRGSASSRSAFCWQAGAVVTDLLSR